MSNISQGTLIGIRARIVKKCIRKGNRLVKKVLKIIKSIQKLILVKRASIVKLGISRECKRLVSKVSKVSQVSQGDFKLVGQVRLGIFKTLVENETLVSKYSLGKFKTLVRLVRISKTLVEKDKLVKKLIS